MSALVFAPIVFCSTLVGGALALKLRGRIVQILGFSAGAVVGVALFDLLPEAFRLAQASGSMRLTSLFMGIGFLIYLILDRLAFATNLNANRFLDRADQLATRGIFGGSCLILHSTCDGIAIGLAFQVSPTIGALVAVAVVAHDFADGMNTTSIILKNGGTRKSAAGWLLADALAPVAGIASTLLVRLPQTNFGLLLAMLAGFFLYLGASDLVPESYLVYPRSVTTLATLFGALVIFAAVTIAG